LSYVVRACDHCSICKYFVWVTGEHTNSENVSNGKTLQYGVPLFIQKIFEEYLEMDSTLSAKSLLIKLTIQIWKVLMVILKPFLPRENDYQ